LLVVGGFVAHPWTARLKPRKEAPATAKTKSVRVTAKNMYATIRGAIFTTWTNMGTG